MVRRLIFLLFILGVMPVSIIGASYLYWMGRSEESLKKAEVVKELNYANESVTRYLHERLMNLRIISQISIPVVALDFKRPEGLLRFLNGFISQTNAYEKIVVLDKNLNFFAISEDQKSGSGNWEELLGLVPQYKNYIAELGENRDSYFLEQSKSIPQITLVSRITDSYEQTVGYYVAQIKTDNLIRVKEILKSRLSLSNVQNVSVNFVSDVANVEFEQHSEVRNCEKVVVERLVGHLCTKVPMSELHLDFGPILTMIVVGGLLVLLLFAFLSNWLVKFVLRPFERFLQDFSKVATGDTTEFKVTSTLPEIRLLEESAMRLTRRINNYRAALEKSALEEASVKIATQLAHDIRSPVLALKMLQKNILNLDDATRALADSAIQRIQDISGTLLNAYKIKVTTELLLPVIQSIVNEKQILLSKDKTIELRLASVDAAGYFSKINLIEMKRLLSNILNNSIEAIGKEGKVVISMSGTEGIIEIDVSDDGCGIPPDLLPIVAQGGHSVGKEQGLGLGLSHAIATVKSLGGSVDVYSELGVGTSVKIQLLRCAPPEWYFDGAKGLGLNVVAVLDAEGASLSIGEKFAKGINLEAKYFYCPVAFAKYVQEHSSEKVLFAANCDVFDIQEIIPDNSKLDAVFVAISHKYNDDIFKRECLLRNIKILPTALIERASI